MILSFPVLAAALVEGLQYPAGVARQAPRDARSIPFDNTFTADRYAGDTRPSSGRIA
jgi:hypothetical protein